MELNARRFTAVLATALLLAPSLVSAQSADTATRVAQWSEDLRVLVAELERRHPDVYHGRTKAEFAASVAQLREQVAARSDATLTLDVMRLVASLGDAHTSVSADFRSLGFHRLAIAPYLFDDGVFIRDADTSLVSLIGVRLIAVNGHPIDSVLRRLRPFIAYENDAQLRYALPGQLVNVEVLGAAGLSSRNDSVTLTVEGPDGRSRDQSIGARLVGAPVEWGLSSVVGTRVLPLFRRNTNRAYWYELLESDSAIYVAYNRAVNDPADPLDAFAERVVAEARARGATKIIVDFRRNQGGNSSVFSGLQRRLIALRGDNPKVQLVGIIGRQTFSSGLWNAVSFQRVAGATLYGEPTGGKPNHFGEVRQFTLPHSKLVVYHSTRRWQLLRDEDPPSLAPNVPVPNRSDDYFALRDPVLATILAPRR